MCSQDCCNLSSRIVIISADYCNRHNANCHYSLAVHTQGVCSFANDQYGYRSAHTHPTLWPTPITGQFSPLCGWSEVGACEVGQEGNVRAVYVHLVENSRDRWKVTCWSRIFHEITRQKRSKTQSFLQLMRVQDGIIAARLAFGIRHNTTCPVFALPLHR